MQLLGTGFPTKCPPHPRSSRRLSSRWCRTCQTGTSICTLASTLPIPLRYKPPAAFAASEEAAPGGIPFGTLFSSSSVPFVDISLINSPVLIEPMVVEFMALQLSPNVTKKHSQRPFIHEHSTFRGPQSESSSENAAERVYISVNAEVLTIQDIDLTLTSGSVFGASRSPCPKRSEPAPGGK